MMSDRPLIAILAGAARGAVAIGAMELCFESGAERFAGKVSLLRHILPTVSVPLGPARAGMKVSVIRWPMPAQRTHH
jgi:hypothetical protein